MKTSLTKIADNLSDKEHGIIAEKICKANCDGIELSIFGGNWGDTWDVEKDYDLSFLKIYKGIRSLSISLPNCTNLTPILELKDSLEHLSFGEFKSKKTSYDFLSELKQLKYLSVVRQPKGLESITELNNLSELALTGYSVDQLHYLNQLKSLRKLYIGFGSSETINSINQLTELEELYILWVKKLSDLSAISNLTSLKKLRIEDEKQVIKLPNLSKLQQLKNIRLMNLSSLDDISSINDSALEEFILTGPNKNPEILNQIIDAKSIKRIYTYYYTNKDQAKAENIIGNKFSNKLEHEIDTSPSVEYIKF